MVREIPILHPGMGITLDRWASCPGLYEKGYLELKDRWASKSICKHSGVIIREGWFEKEMPTITVYLPNDYAEVLQQFCKESNCGLSAGFKKIMDALMEAPEKPVAESTVNAQEEDKEVEIVEGE